MKPPAVQFALRPGEAMPPSAGQLSNRARELFNWHRTYDPNFKAGGFVPITVWGVSVLLDNNILAPRIVIGGVRGGGGAEVLPTEGVYVPAFAFVASPATRGDTFRLVNNEGVIDAVLVRHLDGRSAVNATQYFRVKPNAGETVLYRISNVVAYKGQGFGITGAAGIKYLALVYGDPTHGTIISPESSGRLLMVTTDFSEALFYTATLPPSAVWKDIRYSTSIPVLAMQPAFAVAGYVPICPVHGARRVLLRGYPFLPTASVYRYTEEGNEDAGTEVSAHVITPIEATDLGAHTSGSVSSTAASGTTSYSATQDIGLCPNTQQMTLVSVPAESPIPVSGTITKNVSASGSFVFSAYPTRVHSVLSLTGSVAFTASVSASTSQSFSGQFCGINLEGSESLTWNRNVSASASLSSSRPNEGTPWTGTYANNTTDTMNVDSVRKTLHCVYGDATFGAAAVIEKTVTSTYSFTGGRSGSGTESGALAGNVSWPASWGDTAGVNILRYWNGTQPATLAADDSLPISGDWAIIIPYPFVSGPAGSSGTLTLAGSGSVHEKRELVLYHAGAEVLRTTYYESTTSTRPIDPYLPDPLQIICAPTRAETSASLHNYYFRTLNNMDLRIVDDVNITDSVHGAANEIGLCVELLYEYPGESGYRRIFIDTTSDDWQAQSGVTANIASDNNILYRV